MQGVRTGEVGIASDQSQNYTCGPSTGLEIDKFNIQRATGLVREKLCESMIGSLPGSIALGHLSYGTNKNSKESNIQPLFAEFKFGGMAIAFSGIIINDSQLRSKLVKKGCSFHSTNVAEIVMKLFEKSHYVTVGDRLIDALRSINGMFSLMAITRNKLIGIRGVTGGPRVYLGRLGDAYIFTSRTSALEAINGEVTREVEPGEIVIVDEHKMRLFKPFGNDPYRKDLPDRPFRVARVVI